MDKRRQDDLDGDEEDSVMGSYHTSDEDESSNDGTDVDEYANYNTDLEKYQYDQLRWIGIEHGTKYTIDPRHKEERRKKANSLEYETTSFAERCLSIYAVCLFLLSHILVQPRSQQLALTSFFTSHSVKFFLQALKATLTIQIHAWNVLNAAGLELMNCWGTLWLHSWWRFPAESVLCICITKS